MQCFFPTNFFVGMLLGYFPSQHLSTLRMKGALLEVKSSLQSLTKHLEDPTGEQLQAVNKTLGIKEVGLPKNAARLNSLGIRWLENCLNLDGFRTSCNYLSNTEIYHLDVF